MRQNRKRKTITKCLERNYSFRIELADQSGPAGTGVAKSGPSGYPQQQPNTAPANDAPRYPNCNLVCSFDNDFAHRLPGAINCG